MSKLHKIRQLYGGVYVSIFSDDLIVPWKPLSTGEYIKYHHEHARGAILGCILENEIFKKCVVDETLVRNIDYLPAGVVTVVVEHIWQYSGPQNLDTFNQDLATARELVFQSETKALHEIVDLITRAWPYKPEEVYAMDYETLLLRCAMAEPRLMAAGIISEPIVMLSTQPEVESASNKPRVDAKRLWEEYQASQGIQRPPSPKPPQRASQEPRQDTGKRKKKGRWWKTSPILEAEHRLPLDFQTEALANDTMMLDNHDRLEHPIVRKHLIEKQTRNERAQMIEEAQTAYADVIKALESRRVG